MPRNARALEVFPITTRVLQVIRAVDITPGMRRVTLGGEGLQAHTAPNGCPVHAFRSDGFDDEFKIFLTHPDANTAVAPTQAGGVLNWPREDPHLLFCTYTARRWDPILGELDIDFVVHGVGPATSWARRVQAGESVQIAGPKMSAGHPEGWIGLLLPATKRRSQRSGAGWRSGRRGPAAWFSLRWPSHHTSKTSSCRRA